MKLELEEEMIVASNHLEFEKAALLRDQIRDLKKASGKEVERLPQRNVRYGKGKRRRNIK